MPDQDSVNAEPTPEMDTEPRRAWQPPEAKAVEVAVATRSSVTGYGYDGAYCNS
ncbi:hypothetical protein [Pseudomonas sp. LRF_L74]|uniref:hypothetical protein n=1 Tax=Pseudomonas sp. LRF_L74 TaxID=3369422 RepID=UPI003F6004F0